MLRASIERGISGNELLPCAAGIAAGFAVAQLLPARLRLVALLWLSMVIGFAASALSGELELSFGFIAIDVAEAFGLGLLALTLSLGWQRRVLRQR